MEAERRSLSASGDTADEDVAAIARMARMQQRFQRIMSSVQAEDSDEDQEPTNTDDVPISQAATRWALLRGTIGISSVKNTAHAIKHSLSMKSEEPKDRRSDEEDDEDNSPTTSPRPQETARALEEEEICDEQIDLQFWEDTSIPAPAEPPRFTYHAKDEQSDDEIEIADEEKERDREDAVPREVVRSPSILDRVAPISDYEKKFTEESQDNILELSRIPPEVVEAEAVARERANLEEKQRLADLAKCREADLLMREEKARLEVIEMEQAARTRLLEEKRALIIRNARREKQIGREFRRAKDELEESLRKQQATMKEIHGDVMRNEVDYLHRKS